MKPDSERNIVAENLRAVTPLSKFKGWVSKRKRLCWKCQKDTLCSDGKVIKANKNKILFSGADAFICNSCVALKEKKDE